ncbi:MAG: hypothetical protein NVS2B11_17290 [Acetobacteraceae bacterium]
MVVLGLIIAGLSQGLRLGVRVAGLQERFNDQHGALDALDRSLRRLIAQTSPGSPQSGPTLQGTADRLALVTALPMAGAVEPEADLEIGMAPGSRLVLRWTPHVHAKRLGPSPPPQELELLRGIDGFSVAYWDRGWHPEWHEPNAPTLIRLRLLFPPGSALHWPDIVARPMRQRPE